MPSFDNIYIPQLFLHNTAMFFVNSNNRTKVDATGRKVRACHLQVLGQHNSQLRRYDHSPFLPTSKTYLRSSITLSPLRQIKINSRHLRQFR